MNRSPFPAVWDNTMRSDFVACPRKWSLAHLRFLKAKGLSIHLEAGAALAHAIERGRRVMFDMNYSQDSIQEASYAAMDAIGEVFSKTRDPEGTAKHYDNLVLAAGSYFRHYGLDYLRPLALPTGPTIEFSFNAPIDVRHPVTGDPIIFCGRFDAMCENIHSKTLWGVDEKSTSGIGPGWSKKWPLRAQFMGYNWGARQFGFPLKGFIVRGIAVLTNEIKHVEAIVSQEDWQIDRWYTQLCSDIRRAIAMWEAGYFDYNLSDSCEAYGGCGYFVSCTSDSPESWESTYDRYMWDPLNRKQIPVTLSAE